MLQIPPQLQTPFDALLVKKGIPNNYHYDIRTIQELLGHSDVRMTMIYTHCVPSRTVKEARSPLDF